MVVNCHTVKPWTQTGSPVSQGKSRHRVREEHQVNGGLGSAIAEVLAQRQPVPMEFVGVNGPLRRIWRPR